MKLKKLVIDRWIHVFPGLVLGGGGGYGAIGIVCTFFGADCSWEFHMQKKEVTINFFSLNPPQYESSHHKQDSLITTSKIFHFLFQLQIIKSYNFHLTSACDYEFHKPPHPTIFSTACRRSKESLSIIAATQENLEPIPPLLFLD